MENPRDYAAPGNQDPATPWPDSLVLASAIARPTTRLRVALAAIIAPLRHPLLLAKQLGEARPAPRGADRRPAQRELDEQEYEALASRSHQRGAILDEQELEVMVHRLARPFPATQPGLGTSRFREMYAEPRPYRLDGLQHVVGGSDPARGGRCAGWCAMATGCTRSGR